MTTREILETAKARIANESDWCKGAFMSPDGRVCAAGACRLVETGDAAGPLTGPVMRAWDALVVFAPEGLSYFNDSHTHAEVLALFDQAIAAEKAKEATC